MIKVTKNELESLIATAVINAINALKSAPEFVKAAEDKDILPAEDTKDNELLSKKEKEQQGEEILIID